MLKNKGRTKRKLLTINGWLSFERTLLIPIDGKNAEALSKLQSSKSICPLDMCLGIDNLPFKITTQMMVAIAKEAVRASSYRRAAEIVQEHYGVELDEKTIRSVTDFVATVVCEKCKEEADEAKDHAKSKIDRRKKHRKPEDILYLEMDGAMVNTRRENEKDNAWRECKIGIAFLSKDIKTWSDKRGNLRRAICKKRLTGYIGNYGEFKFF